MENHNFNIKLDDHFKLYIRFKDKIRFEYELQRNNLIYHIDEGQALIDNEIRYFILYKDHNVIDKILKDAGIIASTETIVVGDSQEDKKIVKMYLIVAFIFSVLTILMILFIYLLEAAN